MTRPAPARYPLADLAHAAGAADLADLARMLGITYRHACRLQAEGLSDDQADRYACRLGEHPAAVWPEWGKGLDPGQTMGRRRDEHGRFAS